MRISGGPNCSRSCPAVVGGQGVVVPAVIAAGAGRAQLRHPALHVLREPVTAGCAGNIGTVGLPVTLVLDPQGRIAYRRLGEMRPADIVAALARLGVKVTTQQLAAR